jgi:hypothetical protein
VNSGRPSKRRARLLLSRSDAQSGLVQLRVIVRAFSVSRVDYRRRLVSSLSRVPRLEVAVVRSMGGRPPWMVEVFLVLQTAAPHAMVQAVVACLVRLTAAEGTLSDVSLRVDGRRHHLASASSLSRRLVVQRLVARLVRS